MNWKPFITILYAICGLFILILAICQYWAIQTFEKLVSLFFVLILFSFQIVTVFVILFIKDSWDYHNKST